MQTLMAFIIFFRVNAKVLFTDTFAICQVLSSSKDLKVR